LTNWLSVSAAFLHSAAVKTDGTLWTWGNGSIGRLGDGTTVSKSSPVQIGALTDWVAVDTGPSAVNTTALVGVV
jgi:alpha-tubulin suppressor-like RCC1 family protein